MSATHDRHMEEDAETVREIRDIACELSDWVDSDNDEIVRLNRLAGRLENEYIERYGEAVPPVPRPLPSLCMPCEDNLHDLCEDSNCECDRGEHPTRDGDDD